MPMVRFPLWTLPSVWRSCIAEFATGIGALAQANASKMPDTLTSLKNLINTFVAAEKMVNQANKKVSSATVKTLADSMTALERPYPSTDTILEAEEVGIGPECKGPSCG